ncbi:DMT family transporter [Anaerovoracaceae bacterium 42-11]
MCSCGLGYTFQVIGQRYMEPAKASLLLSSETVFTMIAGMIFFQEKLAFREYLGCALIFCAIILSQMRRKS